MNQNKINIEIQPLNRQTLSKNQMHSRIQFLNQKIKRTPTSLYYLKQRFQLYLFDLKDYKKALIDLNIILSKSDFNKKTHLHYRSICFF